MSQETEREDDTDNMRADIEAALADTAEISRDSPTEPAVESPEKPERSTAPTTPIQQDKTAEKPAEADAPKAEPIRAESEVKAPVSWKPGIREKWATLDPAVQGEVTRREREVTEALRVSAEARRTVDEFARTIAPHMPLIQQTGEHPLRVVDQTLRAMGTLRTGSREARAALVADLVQQFDVDLATLDTLLTQRIEGRAQPAPEQHYMQALDQRLAPIQQFMQEVQGLRASQQQAVGQEIGQNIEQFAADPQNEFFEDVREYMADIIDMATHRGQKITLQDAYRRATMAHPQVSEVVSQRQAQSQVSQQTAAAQRARQAAASIPISGAPTQGNEDEAAGDDIRSALQASIRTHARR
jgi:hypothetical protein